MNLLAITSFLLSTVIMVCHGDRQHIDNYVKNGQQFLILDPDVDATILLYEDPDAKELTLKRVYWFCTPKHAPDTNGDGEFDNIVAHALTFRPESEVDAMESLGATVGGSFTPHGYVASWSTKDGTYEEYLVDFDDTSIHQFIDMDGTYASIAGYETSMAGCTGGFVLSGAGEWVNATDPRLAQIAEILGEELTGESCDKKYAEVWKEANLDTSTSSKNFVSTSFLVLLVSILGNCY